MELWSQYHEWNQNIIGVYCHIHDNSDTFHVKFPSEFSESNQSTKFSNILGESKVHCFLYWWNWKDLTIRNIFIHYTKQRHWWTPDVQPPPPTPLCNLQNHHLSPFDAWPASWQLFSIFSHSSPKGNDNHVSSVKQRRYHARGPKMPTKPFS